MRRCSDERGWVLLTTLVVMVILLGMVAAMLALPDMQRRQAGSERVKETSFNVADSALEDQAAILAKAWPGTASAPYPATCARFPPPGMPSPPPNLCPDPASFAQNFTGTDLDASSNWTISVRDDVGGTAGYYRKSVLESTPCVGSNTVPCTWDSNGDGIVWVRADGTVKGKSVSVVAQVAQALSQLPLPSNAVTAYKFSTGNTGKKAVVDTQGCGPPAGLPQTNPPTCNVKDAGKVAVRCTSTTAPPNGCANYSPSQGQVSPDTVTTGYPGTSVLTATQLDALRSQAQSKGNYWCGAAGGCTTSSNLPGKAGCPSPPSGSLVFVENFTNCPVSGTINSVSSPGALVFNSGTLSMTGNATYYGVVYAANNNSSPTNSGDIVTVTGNAKIVGAAFVDGLGGVSLGASGYPNLVYDPSAFVNFQAPSSNAMLTQNTFRVLPPGQ